jgi:4-methylaminobutanoate oxidase (formaldehyde-forming)
VEQDGQANPVDICMAYAKGARAGGIRILEGVACAGVETRGGAVHALVLDTGDRLRCHAVVNCAGAWARGLGDLANVPVPLQAVEHMYVVTEPIPGLSNRFPVVRDLDNRIYLKGDTGKIVLGGFEPRAKVWDANGADGSRAFVELPDDWDQFEPFMEAGLRRVPALAEAGIQRFMNGPESFTPDSRPLMGESPFLRNFFVAAGFNSIGMMSSAGVGKAMAEWVVAGEAPMDLWEVDIARFDRAAASSEFLARRMEEAVSDVFDLHWPLKQATAGREVRRSVLHRALADAGAVFGAPTGWERPLWFAATEDEARLRYSYGAQHWWAMAARESLAIRDRVGLLDLSPFSKIDVSGREALALVQRLCANEMDVEVGRVTYTQMLNERGGIEADVTVTRTAEFEFRIVSGAPTRYKDIAWVTRQRDRLGFDAGVFDATSGEAVLGVMGPRARALLQPLTDSEMSSAGFPFSTSRRIRLGTADIRATRIGFVGELGWELYIPIEFAESVYERLVAAGAAHGLAHVGHCALEACRLEKGFRHWGHDIGPDDSPLEAGLGFAVAWDKSSRFIGREALVAQRRDGIRRRLMLFAVTGEPRLMLHDEPIYRDGRLVGRTTSGGRGFRTGETLCMGYVDCDRGTSGKARLEGLFEVDVAGERHRLRALAVPAYDPSGNRMRG